MPISIDFTADTRDFVDSVKRGEVALVDVVDALEDVDKAGKKSGKDLERTFKNVSKTVGDASADAKRAAEKTSSSYGNAADETDVHFNSLKKSAKESAKLVTESFDGSAESLISGFQIASQNVLNQFGALGIAGGAALGAGIGTAIGIVNALLADQAAKAEAAKQNVNDLATALIGVAGVGDLGIRFVADNLRELATTGKDGVGTLDDIQKKADEAKVSFRTMAVAYAGGETAIRDAYDGVSRELQRVTGLEQDSIKAGSRNVDVFEEKRKALISQKDELAAMAANLELARQREQEWVESGGAVYEAKANAIASINKAYDDTVASIDEYVDKEKGTLDFEAYVKAVNAKEDALRKYQTALATMNFTDEQKKALEDMGVENAMLWIKGYQKASPAVQAQAKTQLTKAASDASAAANKELDKAFALPKTATVAVNLDKTKAEKDIASLVETQRKKIILDFSVTKNGVPVK